MMDEQVADVSITALKADEGSNDGSEQQSQQQEQTQEEPAFDPKTAYAELKEQLTNLGREAGQSRSMQSKIDKIMTALESRNSQTETKNQSQPDFLGKYSADQLTESEALIEHFVKKKFGPDLERTQSKIQEYESDKIADTFERSARAYAGKDYDTLDPLMTKITAAAYQGAQNGDDEAREFVEVMTKFPKVGARQLVTLAREWHAESVQGKASQAAATQQQRGAATAARTGGGVQRQTGKPDPNTMPIDELRKAVEAELAG